MSKSKLSIYLTPKQIAAIKLALRSTANIRGTEKDRTYLKRIVETIEDQERLKIQEVLK